MTLNISCPGRVNLIGEHIDHQGFSVLPIAIERRVELVWCQGGVHGSITVTNENDNFPSFIIDTSNKVVISERHSWSNYVIAAFIGTVLYTLGESLRHFVTPLEIQKVFGDNINWKIVVKGNIPLAAGLSSSSALLVASTVTFLRKRIAEWKLPSRNEVAEMCCTYESLVGTMGGGMDQAACVLCTDGYALHIQFNPLRTNNVRLPPNTRFVVANSNVSSEKVCTKSTCYNKRVFELRLGCWQLLEALENNKPSEIIRDNISKENVKKLNIAEFLKTSGFSTMELIEFTQKTLSDDVTKEQINNRFKAAMLCSAECLEVWEDNELFHPLSRVLHVCQEKERVAEFLKVCSCYEEGDLSEIETLQILGKCMNQSHQSLATKFSCSTPELDELVSLALANGAYGSRLTGAGWGGCTISLVHANNLETFCLKMQEFYLRHGMTINDLLFCTKAVSGLTTIENDKELEL